MACVLDMPWGPRAPPVTAHCPHHPTPGGRALSGQVGGDPGTEPRGPPGTASLRPAPKLPALGLTAAFTGPSRWAVRSGCPLAPSRGPAGRAWRPRHRGAGGRRPCACRASPWQPWEPGLRLRRLGTSGLCSRSLWGGNAALPATPQGDGGSPAGPQAGPLAKTRPVPFWKVLEDGARQRKGLARLLLTSP